MYFGAFFAASLGQITREKEGREEGKGKGVLPYVGTFSRKARELKRKPRRKQGVKKLAFFRSCPARSAGVARSHYTTHGRGA